MKLRNSFKYAAVLLTTILTMSLVSPSFAVDPDEVLDDPVLEARAREIGRELRCVTCQSQSIDDSDASLAKDLRLVVRERLLVGDSNEEIVAYVTARYGDFVRLKPEMRGDTALLWFAPWLALLGGVGLAVFYFRQHQKTSPSMEADEIDDEVDDEVDDETEYLEEN